MDSDVVFRFQNWTRLLIIWNRNSRPLNCLLNYLLACTFCMIGLTSCFMWNFIYMVDFPSIWLWKLQSCFYTNIVQHPPWWDFVACWWKKKLIKILYVAYQQLTICINGEPTWCLLCNQYYYRICLLTAKSSLCGY